MEEGFVEVSLECLYVCDNKDCGHKEWRPIDSAFPHVGLAHPIRWYLAGYIDEKYKAAAEDAFEKADLSWTPSLHLNQPISTEQPVNKIELIHKITGSMEQSNYSWFQNSEELLAYLKALDADAEDWKNVIDNWLAQPKLGVMDFDLGDKGRLTIRRM